MAFTLTDISSSFDLSKNCSFKVGSESLAGIKSGSVDFSFDGGADNSIRTDGAWKRENPGRGSATVNITYLKIDNDVCQEGIRGWALNSERLTKVAEIIYRTENAATSAGSGFKGNFYLTSYSETDSDDPSAAVEISATFVSYGAVTADNAVSQGQGGSP